MADSETAAGSSCHPDAHEPDDQVLTDAVQKTVAVHACRETDWKKSEVVFVGKDRMQFSSKGESGIQEQFNLLEEARI